MALGVFFALAGMGVAQEPPRTFLPRDGECPWHDRVGQWVIAELPEAYSKGPPMPLQTCSARSLAVPDGTKSAVIGVYLKDFENLQVSHPNAKDTGERFIICSPDEKARRSSRLTYMIVELPDPLPKEVFKPGLGSGIVLLKLDPPPEGPSVPATSPAIPSTPKASSGGLESRPANPPPFMKRMLIQDQEFDAQEWPFRPGPRKAKMWIEEPPNGITPNTGLMLVLHNWGGEYNQAHYLAWCRLFAARYNVVAVSVNYLQSGADSKLLPYDHGYLQAMDCLRALHAVWKQLKDRGVAFNECRVYAMGGSGGGNVTQMAMKLAPRTFACGVDICGMPGLIDAIAYGTKEGTSLNAGYSRDPSSPVFLSKDMQEIRDFGNLDHCKQLKAANPGLQIVIVHGVDDTSCPVGPKRTQAENMRAAGLAVDAHFLTQADVDGKAVTTTGHPVGNRDQVVIKYADDYLREGGAKAKVTVGPSDFSRGDIFEYPTSGGKFVVDFRGPPTIRFEGNAK